MQKAANFTRNTASKCVTARIMRGREMHAQNFSLVEHKTWAAAERAAAAWIKTVKPDLPPPVPIKNRMTKRNTSGIVGVQLKHSVRKGWHHYAWQAFWPQKPGGICFGIVKYGDDRAFVCAAIARRLESADRNVVEQEYHRIKGTAEYRAILRRKALVPP
ncbi:hypothetical protein ACFCQI_03495 [Rhodanobacter sp. FW102-FHT14D06]|uniref:AP2 domain-containing protein n=2 Tax=unclassified Rhodanobacter TaxID=2621553 RepID=A0AB74UVX1_9GAMM